MHLSEAATPSFLVDRSRVERNCARMLEKAKASNVRLRPHVKTHKTIEGARLQLGAAKGPITVSTLAEAEFFADAGFDDITWALPLDPSKLDRIDALGRRIRIQLLIDHLQTVQAIEEHARSRGTRYEIWLKVDSGARRAGVNPESPGAIELAQRIAASECIKFRGLLTHAGHSYQAGSRDEILGIAEEEAAVLSQFRERAGLEGLERSIGSTPTASLVERFPDCEEARPGNYVFFDAFQATLGSCSIDDVAVSVLVSVIGLYPEQNKVIVDGGALAFSKDGGPAHLDPDFGFGIVCDAALRPLPMKLVSMSQEHGQILGSEAGAFARLGVGTRLRIIPNHSCLTAAMFDRYLVHDAEGRLLEEWRPARGW
jgi:D-serine deaminase-like pyridoxal phosphate-dependent protein